MAVRDIVIYPDNEAALRKKSEPVRVVNRRVKKLVKDLKETLLANSNGIGLAAPQINFHSRVWFAWAVEVRRIANPAHPWP